MMISSVTPSPSSLSITQSITGRPATLIIGFGTRCVCGRSLVPLPASGMITCMSCSPVPVLEPDHVVQVVGGRLEDVRRFDRFELVNAPGGNLLGVSGTHDPFLQSLQFRRRPAPPVPDHPAISEHHLAAEHIDRFVLLVVILQAEHVPLLDMQNLTHVAVGMSPENLVAPGLVDALRD